MKKVNVISVIKERVSLYMGDDQFIVELSKKLTGKDLTKTFEGHKLFVAPYANTKEVTQCLASMGSKVHALIPVHEFMSITPGMIKKAASL